MINSSELEFDALLSEMAGALLSGMTPQQADKLGELKDWCFKFDLPSNFVKAEAQIIVRTGDMLVEITLEAYTASVWVKEDGRVYCSKSLNDLTGGYPENNYGKIHRMPKWLDGDKGLVF